MVNPKYKTLAFFKRAEELAESELRFSAICKNNGQEFQYDLNNKDYSISCREVLKVFVWALYRLRDSQGHITRVSIIEKVSYFFRYLIFSKQTYTDQLDQNTLPAFAEWLRFQTGLSYPTAGNIYRSLGRVFQEMSRHHSVSESFRIKKNAFPKSSSLVANACGYDQHELKIIVRAAVMGVRESAAKFERAYQPRWYLCPPPLHDVAPKTLNGGYSKWQSKEYRIWWWENKCCCKKLKVKDLFKISQGQSFFSGMSRSGRGSVGDLERFYEEIGAGEGYKPKYIGLDPPVKYSTPWKKKDFLVWFWENHLGCALVSGTEMKKLSPEFSRALSDHFDGRIKHFFSELGLSRWISASDLVPYYLMLLIRTGLNPSTLQRLSIDCLGPNPLDEKQASISWVKFRASKSSATIPSSIDVDNWPVRLINRLLKITATIRMPGQNQLWIANSNKFKKTVHLGGSAFNQALRDFSVKHKLLSSNGDPLSIQACLIRPTLAWHEYVRTEDLTYLMTLMGHAKLTTTADYVRRQEDPILRNRRSVHQDAMFAGLRNGKFIVPLIVGKHEAIYDCVLNHCKDALKSPQPGQKNGVICSSGHEVCLGCQNLIITLEDVKKYFCFITFHEHLLNIGDIDEVEFSKAVSEKKYFWDVYILPKYPADVLQRLRADANREPFEPWDISIYEYEKQTGR